LRVFRQALELLSTRKRWQLFLVFLSTVLMGIVTTVGVASIMPFIAVLASPETVLRSGWLSWAYARFGFRSTESFLFALGVLTLTVIAVSNAINAANAWLIARFTAGLNHEMSRRLFALYLGQSYAFYLGKNSSQLAKNILAEVAAVVNGVIQPLVLLVAKLVVSGCILLLLMYIDARLALTVAAVLGGMYAMIYLGVRKREATLGRRRVEANAARFRVTAEAFGGIKDVKVLGREAEFLKRFSVPSYQYARANAADSIIGQIPRFALDTIAFGGILIIVLYLLRTYDNVSQVLPIVSLYAFAAYRLMPAFQQIFQSLTKTQFNTAALDDLRLDLSGGRLHQQWELDLQSGARQASEDVPVSFEREIRLEGVGFRYPGAAWNALTDVSLTIRKNTTIALVGATGSGKTTLADLLLGLYEPTHGRIVVDGEPLSAQQLFAWRRRIGYVPQHIYLADDSIRRNIAFGLPEEAVDDRRVMAAGRVAHLEEFVGLLPAGYDTVVGDRGVRLSGGQRQRIGIARALYTDPDVLIMDEATSALDSATEASVMEAIRELAGRRTIVLIAHRLSTVKDCDQIAVLHGGRMSAAGTYDALLGVSSVFRTLAQSTATTTREARDERRRLKGGSAMAPFIEIAGRRIGEDFPPLVIAEIGINHEGSLQVAREMVDAAARAGAEVIKHQTHVIDDEMSGAARNVVPGNATDSIYSIMERCALSAEDERELKEYVESSGMIFISTPFSRAAADRLHEMEVPAYKIGSGECNNYPLLEHIASFGRPVILSTGMNDLESVRKAVAILERYRVPFALLHTTNLYPTPSRLVRLGAFEELKREFPDAVVGLSDHTTSNLACFAATALGASILERHFTDSYNRPGPDMVNSMDEAGLADLISGSMEIWQMRGGRKEAAVEEQVTMAFAFASVVTTRAVRSGEVFTRDNLWVKRPGIGGISPEDYTSLLGRVSRRDIPADTHLEWADVA
jgi:sialic acid synthase SpsE/ABC-type multidrug transport system fused ATPase/permease subunit